MSLALNNWALICTERFTAVWFPLKYKGILIKRLAITSVFAVLAISCLVFAPSVVYSGVTKGVCAFDYDMEGDKSLSQVMGILAIVLNAAIPTFILMVITPLIIYKLYRKESNVRLSSKNSTQHRLTVMLMSVVVVHTLLVTFVITGIVTHVMTATDDIYSSEFKTVIIRETASSAGQMNYSINFILYAVTNTDFRNQLCNISKYCTPVRETCSPVEKERNSGPAPLCVPSTSKGSAYIL